MSSFNQFPFSSDLSSVRICAATYTLISLPRYHLSLLCVFASIYSSFYRVYFFIIILIYLMCAFPLVYPLLCLSPPCITPTFLIRFLHFS